MIFEEQLSRKPDKYPWTQEFIRAMHDGFWTEREFNFQSDIQDFKVKLTDQEREIIVRALSAIAQVETGVKSYWGKISENLPHPSIMDLGFVIANVEVIHNAAYEKLLMVLGLEDVFEENLKLEIIKNRVNYLRKYNHKYYKESKQQFIYSLILFTLFVENVSLFSQFYVINFFGRFKNVLKDTNQQTHYTRQEEQIHALVGVKLINVIRQEHPELFTQELEDKILYEAGQAFKYESQIVDWMINGYDHNKLNAKLLKEFVKDRLNQSLESIGFPKLFDIDRTIIKETDWFEEEVLGNSSSDFFFSRPVEYSKKDRSFNEEDLF